MRLLKWIGGSIATIIGLLVVAILAWNGLDRSPAVAEAIWMP